jgi:hypothetical protein
VQKRTALGIGIGALLVLAAVAVGLTTSWAGASNSGPPPLSQQATDGIAPVVTLANGAQPIAAAADGSNLVVVALTPGGISLDLHRVARTGTVATQPLALENAGLWGAVAVAPDGTVWVGAQDRLVGVRKTGASDSYRLPAVVTRLAAPLAGPSSPMGPVENGQITALAIQGTSLRIGRAGTAELTSFDLATHAFSQQPLPPGVGDIASLTRSGDAVVFSVNHSGTVPGRLADVVGIIQADGRIATTPTGAQSVASNGRAIAVGNRGAALLDASGVLRRSEKPSGYDGSHVAIKANDTTYIRVTGTHEVAAVDSQGNEVSRVAYQVAVLPRREGQAPYTARWTFAITTADDAIWFAAQGRPEIYRLP